MSLAVFRLGRYGGPLKLVELLFDCRYLPIQALLLLFLKPADSIQQFTFVGSLIGVGLS